MASVPDNDDAKQKEHNYIRLNLLVVNLSTFVLKSRFDHAVPPNQLHHKLNQFIGTINYGRKNKIISKKQFDVLFPQTSPPQSEKFDVSLLVYLLRHTCGLDAKCKWWKENDNDKIPGTVVDEVADIVRIRNVRNEIQHLQNASIEQDKYEAKWSLTEEAMLRLGTICNLTDLKNEIETVKNQPFETVKETTSVIMLSHGLDDDYGYSDEDPDDGYDNDDDFDFDTECDDYDIEEACEDYDDFDDGGNSEENDDHDDIEIYDDNDDHDAETTSDYNDDHGDEGTYNDYDNHDDDVGNSDNNDDHDDRGSPDDYDDHDDGGTYDDFDDHEDREISDDNDYHDDGGDYD